ncbi:MAG: anti-sigma factor family protein, partial [Bryobacteraceae bacterium]
MTGKRREEHCSDETLLAHLDGELPLEEHARVSAHLKSCWRCRASLADLERQALALAKMLEADTFPGRGRIAQA